MAFTTTVAGDRYILPEVGNVKPKRPKSGYTAVVGDLVILDTSIADGVDLIATDENPYGIVESINNSNGMLSVAEFVAGCSIELPYSGSVALGDKIEGPASIAQGTTLLRTTVRTDNSNGVGTVVAKDADTPHGTGHCVVRFTGA
jgi:hypothetical protein